MILKKLSLAALVIVMATLSGCVIVPPRAHFAAPIVIVDPHSRWDHQRHWR